MKILNKLILLVFFTIASSLALYAQKQIEFPSSIDDGFVLKFDRPHTQIFIDTDEKNRNNPEYALIEITPRTRFENHKGKQIPASEIKVGMDIKVKMEKSVKTKLVAKSVKVKNNPYEKKVKIGGYLDRVLDNRAIVDGRVVELEPNIVIKGKKSWKGKTFSSFGEIPLGSLVNLRGKKRNGIIYVSKGEANPNTFTDLEKRLLESVESGLTVPPPNQRGAGIKIGKTTFKVVEDLSVNTYVNKVGMRVVPRYLRYLPEDNPSKIVFRFYVLEHKSPNAFATSDGSVFIFTGLLAELENEAQLAIILGHEISHVTNEHSRRRIQTVRKQALWMGIAGAVVGSLVGDQAGLALSRLGYGLMSSRFSRSLEDQADRVGLYYTYEAGYDIRESTQIWRRLLKGRFNETKVSRNLYRDHPSMLERLRTTRKEIILNYSGADFSEVIIGREEYNKIIMGYFYQGRPVLKRRF